MNTEDHGSRNRNETISLTQKFLMALLLQTITIIIIIMRSYGDIKQQVALNKQEIEQLKEKVNNLEHTIYRYNRDQ